MISFKQYLNELDIKKQVMRPQDIARKGKSKDITVDKQVDFDDPAYSHQFKKPLKDADQWPPKPAAKYKADQIRWAVSVGKQPQHLANET